MVFSKIERCQNYAEIKHPAVRETFRFLQLERGLEIHHGGDQPARSGMGPVRRSRLVLYAQGTHADMDVFLANPHQWGYCNVFLDRQVGYDFKRNLEGL